MEKLVGIRDNFWTKERLDKAAKLGLTPVEVATIASIVEEESNKKDERPMIARLYINRVKQGMKLQADPTVKFATGNFALRRITGKHLRTDSPYNTYKNVGLPPALYVFLMQLHWMLCLTLLNTITSICVLRKIFQDDITLQPIMQLTGRMPRNIRQL